MSGTKLGLGLGMDLQWNSEYGFIPNEKSFEVSERVQKFLTRNAELFNYFFFSFQPNDFDLLTNKHRVKNYFGPYDEILSLIPLLKEKIALHHTMLNLGSMENYPRERIIEITNELIERYNIKWINEDLGVWNLNGKSLPYPMPPFLTERGLRCSIDNIRYCQKNLKAPLFVEFPGFSEGGNFFLGEMDAFDFYKTAIEETNCHATLDTGHILSYQWMKGNTKGKILNGLDIALPFEQCAEIHLSGCSLVGGRFVDFHHGVILDEQLEILDYLLERCPNLKGVTYEDPKFTVEGELVSKAIPNFMKLKKRVDRWSL